MENKNFRKRTIFEKPTFGTPVSRSQKIFFFKKIPKNENSAGILKFSSAEQTFNLVDVFQPIPSSIKTVGNISLQKYILASKTSRPFLSSWVWLEDFRQIKSLFRRAEF
jgi:hypothetical protein